MAPNIDHSLPRCPDCELSHSVFINEEGNVECMMCGRVAKENGEIIKQGWQDPCQEALGKEDKGNGI